MVLSSVVFGVVCACNFLNEVRVGVMFVLLSL